MAEKRNIEQQQRQEEAKAAKWRQIEPEHYFARRNRERHIDWGRECQL